MPGSTRKPLTWPSSVERAQTTATSAIVPLPIQRLAPSITQVSPSRRARVSSAMERERPRELRALPVVVDDREHLLVDEAAGAHERLPFGVVELLADEEVVGDECGAEHQVISGSASAAAIAR